MQEADRHDSVSIRYRDSLREGDCRRREVDIVSSGVKVRIRLLLAGLPYGSLRDFFLGVHDQKKDSPARLYLDTCASALPSIGRRQN